MLLPSRLVLICDRMYGSWYVAQAVKTGTNLVMSIESNQIPGPAGPVTYVRTFVSGKVPKYGIAGTQRAACLPSGME